MNQQHAGCTEPLAFLLEAMLCKISGISCCLWWLAGPFGAAAARAGLAVLDITLTIGFQVYYWIITDALMLIALFLV